MVLFVDIDGVLITRQSMRRFKSARVFDPNCVRNFNFIIKNINPDIVVSSTWRIKRDIPELIALFRKFGAEGNIIGKTPHISYDRGQRGLEIHRWLTEAKYSGDFVVIDDEVSDMGDLLPKVVQTNMDGGLCFRHVALIFEHFGVKMYLQ